MGKHVYCQKATDTDGLRSADVAAARQGQEGSPRRWGQPGEARAPACARAVEVIQSGLIGNVSEVPRLVESSDLAARAGRGPKVRTRCLRRSIGICGLGPAKVRPYKKDVYAPFQVARLARLLARVHWGDMACHTVNMPFRAVKMGYPNVVECEIASRVYDETFPKSSRLRFEFPEREGSCRP